jgi:hypothetical protein
MPDQNLEFIGSMFCEQYVCEAGFYLESPYSGEARPATATGLRHLIVRYGEGYTGRMPSPGAFLCLRFRMRTSIRRSSRVDSRES